MASFHFPSLELALVPDVLDPEMEHAWGAREAEISFQISANAVVWT